MPNTEKERLCRYLGFIKSSIEEEDYQLALEWVEIIRDKLN